MYLRPAGAGPGALVGCSGRKGLPLRPASLLGFLRCPEGGGNLAWSPIFSGATERVSGYPGGLERRARLSGRWVGCEQEGAPVASGVGPVDSLWLISILEQVFFRLGEMYSNT